MQRQFVLRVVTGVIAAPVVIVAAWVGGLWLALLLGVLCAVGTWELYRFARADGLRPVGWLGIPLAFAVPMLVHAATNDWFYVPVSAALAGILAVLGVVLFTHRAGEKPLASAAVTVLAVLYTAGTMSFSYGLRYHPLVIGSAAGAALVTLPVWLTWSTDTGAYLFGRIFGGPKLMPSVSPGKTISGAIGGLLTAVGMAFAYIAYVLHPAAEIRMTTGGTILFAVAISVAGQVGDLFESLIKREAGVKDSSQFFPGHGGVLDRLDSMFFIMPLAYLMLPWFLVAAPIGAP
ncbi:MAG: phosphatidate cytidylyltransferase [Gemmatimonadetes bacterium]|nr:phosphatidate cytidylyltransferase [Gemmatimonadota bacterium]